MSPGGQTPLLLRCLFSAAFVDSPAEELGREVIKEQKEKTEGIRWRKTEQKVKLIKKLNKGRKKAALNRKRAACEGDDIQCLGDRTSAGLPQGKWEELLGAQPCGSKPVRASVYKQLHVCVLPLITAFFPNMEQLTFLEREILLMREQAIVINFIFLSRTKKYKTSELNHFKFVSRTYHSKNIMNLKEQSYF